MASYEQHSDAFLWMLVASAICIVLLVLSLPLALLFSVPSHVWGISMIVAIPVVQTGAWLLGLFFGAKLSRWFRNVTIGDGGFAFGFAILCCTVFLFGLAAKALT